MKILHISDTHGYHNSIVLPSEHIDVIIHSGDFSNNYKTYINEKETLDFIRWYGKIKVPYKILVAGNHDAYACNKTYDFREVCRKYGIIYLENQYYTINNYRFFGSPITPTYNTWYFQKPRHKLSNFWNQIDEKIDVFITHGPPKGILDLAYRQQDNQIERCGDLALLKKLQELQPKLVLFGHIHNNKDIINTGIRIIENTIYSNAACIKDNKYGNYIFNGNILTL